jgi:hypothetical protein
MAQIDFNDASTHIIDRKDGYDAQRTLAGIAFNAESYSPETVNENVQEVLETVGLLQYLEV